MYVYVCVCHVHTDIRVYLSVEMLTLPDTDTFGVVQVDREISTEIDRRTDDT